MKTIKHLLRAILNARNIANNISFNPPSHNPVSDYIVMPMLQIKKLKLSDLKSCKPVKNRARILSPVLLPLHLLLLKRPVEPGLRTKKPTD